MRSEDKIGTREIRIDNKVRREKTKQKRKDETETERRMWSEDNIWKEESKYEWRKTVWRKKEKQKQKQKD